MKTIRSLMTLFGFSVVIFALSAIGAKAQELTSTQFAGRFTLPHEVQWGGITLPAGDYSLYYGGLYGTPMAYVTGRADGSPHGFILARPNGPTSATRNSLKCIRDGNTLVVRKLELPAIGESVNFQMPRGMKLMAHKQKHGKYTLAEAPVLIQRVPVTVNGK